MSQSEKQYEEEAFDLVEAALAPMWDRTRYALPGAGGSPYHVNHSGRPFTASGNRREPSKPAIYRHYRGEEGGQLYWLASPKGEQSYHAFDIDSRLRKLNKEEHKRVAHWFSVNFGLCVWTESSTKGKGMYAGFISKFGGAPDDKARKLKSFGDHVKEVWNQNPPVDAAFDGLKGTYRYSKANEAFNPDKANQMSAWIKGYRVSAEEAKARKCERNRVGDDFIIPAGQAQRLRRAEDPVWYEVPLEVTRKEHYLEKWAKAPKLKDAKGNLISRTRNPELEEKVEVGGLFVCRPLYRCPAGKSRAQNCFDFLYWMADSEAVLTDALLDDLLLNAEVTHAVGSYPPVSSYITVCGVSEDVSPEAPKAVSRGAYLENGEGKD